MEKHRADLISKLETMRLEHEEELAAREQPNHVSCVRFTVEDLGLLAASVKQQQLHPPTTLQLADGPLEAPLPVQNAIEEIARGMCRSGDEDKVTPWWCRVICRDSSAWQGVALSDADDIHQRFYLLTWSSANPHLASFLELRPRIILMVEGSPPPVHRLEFEWLSPLRILPEHMLPFGEHSEIVIALGVHFDGAVAATNRDTMDFDQYARTLPPPVVKPADAGRTDRGARAGKRLPTDVVGDLLREHAWLDPDDFGDPRLHPRKRHICEGPVGIVPPPPPGEEEEDWEVVLGEDDEEGEEEADWEEDEDIADELREARELLDADGEGEFFYTRVLGGLWTKKNKGDVVDFVVCQCRAGFPKNWCQLAHFPKSRRFSMRRYSPEGARQLALEVARRGNFFCQQYFDSDGEIVHTPATNSEYEESLPFLDWALDLDMEDPCMLAVMQIRDLQPWIFI